MHGITVDSSNNNIIMVYICAAYAHVCIIPEGVFVVSLKSWQLWACSKLDNLDGLVA